MTTGVMVVRTLYSLAMIVRLFKIRDNKAVSTCARDYELYIDWPNMSDKNVLYPVIAVNNSISLIRSCVLSTKPLALVHESLSKVKHA